MTEMEQEIRASLHADVMLRKALDIKDANDTINRLRSYYDDPNNGINTCFIAQRIKELEEFINQLNK